MLLLQKKPPLNEIEKKVSLEARLDESVNKKIVQFNEFKNSVELKKAKLEKEISCLEAELGSTIAKLENEVNLLEERKKQALQPLDKEKKAIEKLRENNVALQDDLNDRISLMAVELRKLDDRKDELDEKAIKLAELLRDSQQVKAKNDSLLIKNEIDADLLKNEKQKFNDLMLKREAEIKLKEKDLINKSNSLNIMAEHQRLLKIDLENREKLLISRQEALKSAIITINKRKV